MTGKEVGPTGVMVGPAFLPATFRGGGWVALAVNAYSRRIRCSELEVRDTRGGGEIHRWKTIRRKGEERK